MTVRNELVRGYQAQGGIAQALSELTRKPMSEVDDHGAGTPIECHRAADLVRWIAVVIAKMGGTTLIGEAQENLCRRANAQEMLQFGGLQWVVEARGLPNLIHEFIHILFLGSLDDDHGFNYGEIPLNVGRREHRAALWEELACCAISTSTCAPLWADPRAFARSWFAEQFEIQGVFHGLEDDLEGFRQRVDQQIRGYEAELIETVERGRQSFGAALAPHGGLALIPPCDAVGLWRDYLANCNPAKPGRHSEGRSQTP